MDDGIKPSLLRLSRNLTILRIITLEPQLQQYGSPLIILETLEEPQTAHTNSLIMCKVLSRYLYVVLIIFKST